MQLQESVGSQTLAVHWQKHSACVPHTVSVMQHFQGAAGHGSIGHPHASQADSLVLLDAAAGGTFALYATICRACGIPPVNAGPMPADKQLYEAVSAPQSVISTPINSMRQLQPPVTSQACEASEGTKHLELAERTDAAKVSSTSMLWCI